MASNHEKAGAKSVKEILDPTAMLTLFNPTQQPRRYGPHEALPFLRFAPFLPPFSALPPSFNVTGRTAIQGKHTQLTKHCTPLCLQSNLCCIYMYSIYVVSISTYNCVLCLYAHIISVYIYMCVCVRHCCLGLYTNYHPSPDPAAALM